MSSNARVACLFVVWLGVTAAPGAQAPRLDGKAIHATVQILAAPEFEGRRTGSAGGLKARAWIAGRFKTIGLAPLDGTYEFPFAFTRNNVEYTDAANIVGLCKGTSAAADMLVISAHYDHLGVQQGRMYPGADDNASGVAVLLALAEHCLRSPFRHDALFVAFDGEELGLQGARAFLANPPVPRERFALNVNLDMVGRNDAGELYAAGSYHWQATKPVLEEVGARATLELKFGHDRPKNGDGGEDDWTNQSDHGRFHAAGIPFVYFGVEDHPDYHKATDTADKIDPVFLGNAASTILDAVISLDAALPIGR